MSEDLLKSLKNESMPYAEYLGIELTEAALDVLKAEVVVARELCNRHNIMHGGAVMSFADNLGGLATGLNLDDEHMTTTIESKTNFLAAIPMGQRAFAECRPIHRGRKTMVWQTTITREDGKTAAVVTQTQLVIKRG